MRATRNNSSKLSGPAILAVAAAVAGLAFAAQAVTNPSGKCTVGPAYAMAPARAGAPAPSARR
jgi:hypothetical protein